MTRKRRKHHLKGGYDSSWIRSTTRLGIYLRDALCCVYCMQDWSIDGLTIDHIVSRSDGGSNEHTNIVSACMRCNAMKRSAGTWERFAEALGVDQKWLMVRLREQARPLTLHVRRRANHAVKFPPPWLRELRDLNKNWSPQQPLFPPEKKIVPMVHVEQPEDAPDDTPLDFDDEVPF